MGNLLFNPNGRIASGPFWTGIIILLVANIVLAGASAYVNTFLGLISIVLIYPAICVWGKRLHDNNKSAWLVLVVLIAYIAVSYVLGMVITPILAGDAQAQLAELNRRAMAGEVTDLAEVMRTTQSLSQAMLPAQIANSVLTTIIVALPIGLLPSDPNENKHGPPPAAA